MFIENIALIQLDEKAEFSNQVLEPCSSYFFNCGGHYEFKAVGTFNRTDSETSQIREIVIRESYNFRFLINSPYNYLGANLICSADLEKKKLSTSDYGTALFATNRNDKAVCMYGMAIGADEWKSEYGLTYFLQLTKLKDWLDQFLTEQFSQKLQHVL